MNNFPLIQLSHRLGHADPHVTLKVYSHFVKGMEVQIEEYMEKIRLKLGNNYGNVTLTFFTKPFKMP